MRFIIVICFVLIFSSSSWSKNKIVLTVILGNKIIFETSDFKKQEYCGFFANRLNNQDKIIDENGKVKELSAFCSYVNKRELGYE